MNWDDLREFLVLTRSRLLTQATRLLEVDQSTVGRRLSALEAALGTTLFLRAKTGLTLKRLQKRVFSMAKSAECVLCQVSRRWRNIGQEGLMALLRV